MNSLMEILQDAINEELNIDIAIGKIESEIEKGENKSKVLPILRTLKCFRENKWMDFMGNLRQCLCYYKSDLIISDKLYSKILEYKDIFGFVFGFGENHTINIDNSIISNDLDLNSNYNFIKRRIKHPTLSDGCLYKYFDYQTYTSLSQKMLMYMISKMDKNETLLACLPTGAGKSLMWELPAICGMNSGLIIVVVPTIALAIDHERTSKKAYENILGCSSFPMAYYSGTSNEKKETIFRNIENGTLPILYISPEALLQKNFRNRIIDAAKNDKVRALYIDEAHLIVNWGVKFRPEFQLLSSFRDTLKANCRNGLKTILLSATYTQEDTNIIKNLFKDDVFTEYRADELRPEPSYYLKECQSEEERISIVNSIVAKAPRPIIIYNSGPSESKKYYESLLHLGYNNIAAFSGETSNVDRETIIDQWNKNEIDIIIATSAFGMGVDKADIRTIITTYTPENISRFYQEVGRAGRDGYASLNYFLPFAELDEGYVKSITQSVLLTTKSLIERWTELLKKSKRVTPDTIWLDITVPPKHLQQQITGKLNAGWNKEVILLLLRARLIDIIDIEFKNEREYKVLVKLKNIPVLEDPIKLNDHISEHRQSEKEKIRNDIISVNKLIKSRNKDCYSTYLTNEYPYAEKVCNGCPYCMKHNLSCFSNPGRIYIESNRNTNIQNYVNSADIFDIFIQSSKEILLSYDEHLDNETIDEIVSLLAGRNINIIIIPDYYKPVNLFDELSYFDNNTYMIMTLSEVKSINIKWLYGICGAIFIGDENYDNDLFDFIEKYKKSNNENKVIYIAPTDKFNSKENKALSELVEQSFDIDQFLEV